MVDAKLPIYSLGNLKKIHELEPLTSFAGRPAGAPGGMLFESGSVTWVPLGWTKIWPIQYWQSINGTAQSRVGSTDPETLSTVYLDYLGEEMLEVGDPPALMLTSAFVFVQSSGYAPLGDATETVQNTTFYISHDFGESWKNFFQLNGRFKLNGVLSDRLAQNMAIAATRVGMLKSEEAGDKPLVSRLVLDNTFFNEYHQLWLEDENERIQSRGGIGVKPFLESGVPESNDEKERLAVHSGTWGVIRKRNTIVASTFCPVNWCQNSDAIQIPVPDAPFNYSVNYPKDILWIGPAMYINSYNDPSINAYFQGRPQDDALLKWTTQTGYWGEANEIGWVDDGMRLSGSGGNQDANYFDGWSTNLTRAYWDPNYRSNQVNYSYPYTSYWKPTGTTVILLKQNKTEGDHRVFVPQVPGGHDEITTGHPFKTDLVWWDARWFPPEMGYGWSEYGYRLEGTTIYDPYATSIWSFAAFKKLMLSLRSYAPEVAKAVIEQWGGIVRYMIRTPAERDYWNNIPCEIKNRDMCQMGCTIVGEYNITGRHNNMTRALFTELTYYSASFLKFFIAEENSGDVTGNIIFEFFQSSQNPNHYGVGILPSKSFGNVIYGIKSYYEKTHSIERRQGGGYNTPVYTYNQDQYGMIQYTPVVSEDGGVTWHDVTGLTNYNHTTPRVQFKPIWLGGNQWICEYNSKVYKSFTGVGWSPLEYTPDEEWAEKLDPALDEVKTYPIAVPCRNEWLVIHQYEGLPSSVFREEAVLLDKTHLRVDKPVLSVDNVLSTSNGFEREYPVKSITGSTERTLIELAESLPTVKVRQRDKFGRLTGKWDEVLMPGITVYVNYQTKANTARLFHIITDGYTDLTYIIKDLSFVGDEWFPKQDLDLTSPYDPQQGWKCAINSLSGGLLSHLYYRDPIISAKANLFPSTWEPIEFLDAELPDIIIGQPYFVKLQVSGGTSDYQFTGLTLPPGVTLDRSSGEATGVVATEADLSFGVVVDDSSTPAYADPEKEPAADDENPPLYGYIYNGAGEAVEGASVSIVNPQTGEVVQTVQTNARGRYTLSVPANTPMTLRMGKGECVGSDLVAVTGGSIGRWDGNIGNGTKGTTNMGVGVNQKPPYDQQRATGDPATADQQNQGTRGTQWPVATGWIDDRAPEYIQAEPNFERFVFGQPVSIKLMFSYTDPNRDENADPFVTMVYNSPGFPPDLLPAPRPTKYTETEFREIVGPGIANFLMFGPGRFGLEVEITGTLDQNDGNGQPYEDPVTFFVPPIGLIDSKGRAVYSSTITLTGVPLSGEESVAPVVVIDSPQNYELTPLGEMVTVAGSASDDSGLSSLTVGGITIPITEGAKRQPFSQTITLGEPGCIKIDVVAVDASMKRNTTTESVYVRTGSDSQGPNLTVSAPSNEEPVYMFSPTYEFSGSASDSGRGDAGVKQVKIGNQIVEKSSCNGSDSVNWTHKYTGLTLGTNVVTITAEDYSGNTTSVTRTIVRHEDSVGPKISITSPDQLDIYSYGSEHTIKGGATDSGYGNNGVKRLTFDGVDLYQPPPADSKKATCEGSGSVSFEKQVNLAMGYNSFNIVAWDELNNRTEVTVIIRRIAP